MALRLGFGRSSRFNQVWSTENVSLSLRITARSITFCSSRTLESLGFPSQYQGREKIHGFFNFVQDLYPDLKFHDVKIVCETPEVVVAEYEFTTPSSKTGRVIHQLFVGRLESANGKIKLLRESLNLVELWLAIDPNGLADYRAPVERAGKGG